MILFYQKMKQHNTRRLIGGASALLGLCWSCLALYPLAQGIFAGDRETNNLVFLFTMVPFVAIPGILAVVFGVRLFRSMDESSLKCVVGIFAFFGAFWLSSCLSANFPEFLPEGIQDTAFLFMSGLLAIPSYLFVVRFLLRYLTKQDHIYTSLLSRGVLILMAWQLWLLLSSIFDEYSPIKEGYTHIHEAPWDTLEVLVPVIVAYTSYRTFAALLPKAQQNTAEPPAAESV